MISLFASVVPEFYWTVYFSVGATRSASSREVREAIWKLYAQQSGYKGADYCWQVPPSSTFLSFRLIMKFSIH